MKVRLDLVHTGLQLGPHLVDLCSDFLRETMDLSGQLINLATSLSGHWINPMMNFSGQSINSVMNFSRELIDSMMDFGPSSLKLGRELVEPAVDLSQLGPELSS
ncbi:MAG: hypothetical protein NZ742_12130 [Acidobacteria bacterium]|nr:hypothetical protein [Acidobacteriota bacterium]